MKEERKTIFIGSIFNLIVSMIKLVGGILFGIHALVIDSIYTFCDFITDIISIIGSKLAGKRPTKYHPFGFGRVEYLTNLLMSTMMFIVSTILLIRSFNNEYEVPNILALVILMLAITMKFIMITFLKQRNKEIKSHPLEEGISESTIDLISSLTVGVAIILLQFSNQVPILKYSDLVASIIVTCMIYRTSWVLLKNNILNLIGTVEVDEELNNYIKEELKDKKYEIHKIELIKYGRYYKIHLVVCLDGNTTLRQAKLIQQKITRKLKLIKKIKIKVVNVDLDIKNVN